MKKDTRRIICTIFRLLANAGEERSTGGYAGTIFQMVWIFGYSVQRSVCEMGKMSGDESGIFVDDLMVARREGVVRRIHGCRKLARPVLTAEADWEVELDDRRLYVYGTVFHDPEAGGFRMWYMRFPNRVLYATSDDGIHWERPNLRLVDFQGSTENNILPIRLHSPSIVVDPDGPDAEQRYRMLGYAEVDGKRGYCIAHSPDGLQWELEDGNPVLDGGDTCTLSRDPQTGEFLAFHKLTHEYRGRRRRLVYLATSGDMRSWSEPRLVMAPDERDDEQVREEGGVASEFYNMSAFPWGGQWLGLVTHFRYSGKPGESGPGQSGDDGPIDVQLVHSRDGRSWSRCEDRSPVLPNGPHGYDAGCILGVSNSPVVVDDEMWIYYSAITTTHGGYLPKKEISIARAAWRLDGWVSLDAGWEGGMVETVALNPAGSRLRVNADAARGELRVELLDDEGRILSGYGAEECESLREDGVDQAVRWKERKELPVGRPIRLRFLLQSARLFSWRAE